MAIALPFDDAEAFDVDSSTENHTRSDKDQPAIGRGRKQLWVPRFIDALRCHANSALSNANGLPPTGPDAVAAVALDAGSIGSGAQTHDAGKFDFESATGSGMYALSACVLPERFAKKGQVSIDPRTLIACYEIPPPLLVA